MLHVAALSAEHLKNYLVKAVREYFLARELLPEVQMSVSQQDTQTFLYREFTKKNEQ